MRGVTIYANWTAQQTTGKFKNLLTAQASKFDMEGVSHSKIAHLA